MLLNTKKLSSIPELNANIFVVIERPTDAPQYRGYEYILVGDDILIVDPVTLRIVVVISA